MTYAGTIVSRGRAPAPFPRSRPLNRLGVVMALRRNPLAIWTERHFTERALAGEGLRGYGVFLADPEGIRRVLVENAANYPKDDLQRKILAPGLGQGLLVAEGELWRRTRRILAPVFTPRRVAAQASAMQGAAEAIAARLARMRPGRIVDAAEEMTRATYDVLKVTLFSNGLAGDAASFSQALTRYFNTQGVIDPLDLFDAPAFLPRIGTLRSRPALRFFEERVAAIVAERRALIEAGTEPPDDLLTALLKARDAETGMGLTEREVGANIVTFIGAGHETTANALTWSLYLLSTAPDVRDAVEAEAEAAAGSAFDLAAFPVARAVVEEAMRLYPPVALLSRQAVADDVAAGVRIPAGATVAISPWVLHRHRALWSAPDEFRPERFLPGARDAIDRFAYLPFGVGPRVCIGLGFALQEAVILLSALSRRVRLDHAGEVPPEPVQRITLRPKGGMPVRLSRR
ncbi:cytochrome P450 [Hansschlegelia zhihuaiae]|uniref:Cytochrome P450 n=1 Tax=Hansschlegelia zhihuaiae TaxID=405005 RepID=A0A4Q0MI96_9HYPH|nr:cytochrome P450 [Hansschlegelia zhihuaiae]RXF73347.1 cytochrome P450 [Hansschlegelia zhihuaiae]